jgi:hypothetical protein
MTEAEGSVGWRARAVGPRRLYARLLFDLADFGAWTWRVFVVGVPAVTFAVGWVFGGQQPRGQAPRLVSELLFYPLM